jgi:hypothetical protein
MEAYLLISGFVALILIWVLRSPREQPRPCPYHSCKTILTPCELAFFACLRAAVPPGLVIFPKVRLADVITCLPDAWKEFGWKIGCKHVDFVLADERTTAIRVVIELDDRTHEHPARQERDRFVNQALDAAEVPIVHIKAAARYNPSELRGRIKQALGRGKPA